MQQEVRVGAEVVEDGVQVTDRGGAEPGVQRLAIVQELEVRGGEFPQLRRSFALVLHPRPLTHDLRR